MADLSAQLNILDQLSQRQLVVNDAPDLCKKDLPEIEEEKEGVEKVALDN